MCEKVNFNVIEKNKYDNIDDITKFINNIVNKLIVNEFAKRIEDSQMIAVPGGFSGGDEPEGSAKFNQKLSQARAEAVKKALVKRYHIDADRLTATGMGATNKLSSQVEFNRVATFSNNK